MLATAMVVLAVVAASDSWQCKSWPEQQGCIIDPHTSQFSPQSKLMLWSRPETCGNSGAIPLNGSYCDVVIWRAVGDRWSIWKGLPDIGFHALLSSMLYNQSSMLYNLPCFNLSSMLYSTFMLLSISYGSSNDNITCDAYSWDITLECHDQFRSTTTRYRSPTWISRPPSVVDYATSSIYRLWFLVMTASMR